MSGTSLGMSSPSAGVRHEELVTVPAEFENQKHAHGAEPGQRHLHIHGKGSGIDTVPSDDRIDDGTPETIALAPFVRALHASYVRARTAAPPLTSSRLRVVCHERTVLVRRWGTVRDMKE